MKCAQCGCDVERVRAGGHVYCDHLCCGPLGVPPGSAADHLARAAIHQRQGRLPEALEETQRATRAEPGLGRAHASLALLAIEAGRYDLAWQSVRAAEKLGHPKAAPLRERLQRLSPEPPPESPP